MPSALILSALSFLLMAASLCLTFLYAPVEESMGMMQKIFYVHVPVSWIAFLAFFVVFLSSVLYIWKRDEKWDRLANSSAELGFIFTILALVSGSIWARVIWGVWWTWDARLTTTLVLWFIYLAYFIVRLFSTEEAQAPRLASIIGVVGFIDVPICGLAIVLWRTHHPHPLVFEHGLTSEMLITLLVSVCAFTSVYLVLMYLGTMLKTHEHWLRKFKE